MKRTHWTCDNCQKRVDQLPKTWLAADYGPVDTFYDNSIRHFCSGRCALEWTRARIEEGTLKEGTEDE